MKLQDNHDHKKTYLNALHVNRDKTQMKSYGSQHPINEVMKANTPIEQRILRVQKELDPQKDEESRRHFLSMFPLQGSLIQEKERKALEETIEFKRPPIGTKKLKKLNSEQIPI